MVGKDKGKQGNVSAYIRELNAVFVSGLNLVRTSFHAYEWLIFILGNSTNHWWCCGCDVHCCQRKTVDCSISSQINRSIRWVT